MAAFTTASITGSGAITVRVKIIFSCGTPEPPLKAIEPLYGPAPRLAGFTDTERMAGVVAALCVTESHPLLEAVAANVTACPVEVTDTVCAAGGGLPVVYANASGFGVAARDAAPETVSVTATVCATPPVGVTVMLPLYVPGARPAGLTETLKLTFPVPDAGVTASHAPPVLVPALAVKLCEPVICRLCAAGSAPFCVYANASVDGLMVTGTPPPATLNVTEICVTTPPVVIKSTAP